MGAVDAVHSKIGDRERAARELILAELAAARLGDQLCDLQSDEARGGRHRVRPEQVIRLVCRLRWQCGCCRSCGFRRGTRRR